MLASEISLHVLAVSGSLQARSSNRTLLERARATAPPGVEVVIFEGLRELPPFDPETGDDDAPGPVRAWREALAGSDAVLFASPEYGFSVPGILKNAIDWVIGSAHLEGKVVGVTAAVKIAGRGRRGLEALSEPLRAVSARIVGGASVVQGPSFDRDVAGLVADLVREVREPATPPDHGLGRPRPSALVLEWVARRGARDAAGMAQLFARDATLESPGAPRAEGRDAIARALGRETMEPREVEHLLEDGVTAVLVWRDASGRRGCTVFTARRWEIASQRDV